MNSTNVLNTHYTGRTNYFFNEWARLTLNHIARHEEITQIHNDIFEAQLQLTF